MTTIIVALMFIVTYIVMAVLYYVAMRARQARRRAKKIKEVQGGNPEPKPIEYPIKQK